MSCVKFFSLEFSNNGRANIHNPKRNPCKQTTPHPLATRADGPQRRKPFLQGRLGRARQVQLADPLLILRKQTVRVHELRGGTRSQPLHEEPLHTMSPLARQPLGPVLRVGPNSKGRSGLHAVLHTPLRGLAAHGIPPERVVGHAHIGCSPSAAP